MCTHTPHRHTHTYIYTQTNIHAHAHNHIHTLVHTYTHSKSACSVEQSRAPMSYLCISCPWTQENLLVFLDAPNEFFYDKTQHNLYLYYNGSGTPKGNFVATSLETILHVSVIWCNHCHVVVCTKCQSIFCASCRLQRSHRSWFCDMCSTSVYLRRTIANQLRMRRTSLRAASDSGIARSILV